MQGWVKVDDDDEWKHISVGNERLLKAFGGKIRPSKKLQAVIDNFTARNHGGVILYVALEDEIKSLLALSGIVIFSMTAKSVR